MNITQTELAEMIKLSRASMTNIEAGKQKITVDKLYLISKITGFKISEFIEDSGRELPERIEYVSKIDIAILARLENIPYRWLKALIKLYESVGNKADTGESNCTIFSVSESVCPICGDTGYYTTGGSFGGATQTHKCNCGANVR